MPYRPAVLIATTIGAIVMTTAGEPVTAWQGAQSSTAAQTRLAAPPPQPPPWRSGPGGSVQPVALEGMRERHGSLDGGDMRPGPRSAS